MLRHTEFKNYLWDNPFNYNDQFLFIGSCFTQHLSQYLSSLKFGVISNPFGNVYNPYSIVEQLNFLCEKKDFKQGVEVNSNKYFHWSMHSDITAKSLHELYAGIKEKISDYKHWYSSDGRKVLVITLGTSWVYELIQSNDIVGNCHKYPAKLFAKKNLSLDYLLEILNSGLEMIRTQLQHDIHFIITVSPVRYLRDGFVENQRSKARLLLTAENLASIRRDVSYFPSYELFMDDLRDYRYCGNDLVHPNEMAVEYIREKFTEWCFDDSTQQIIKDVKKLNRAMSHKLGAMSFGKDLEAFANSQLRLIKRIEARDVSIDLSGERNYFNNLLI